MPGRLGLVWVLAMALACSSSVELEAECPSERAAELDAVTTAVEALEQMNLIHREAMTTACANIMRDLTGEDIGVPMPSHDQAEEICTAAHAEIEAHIDDGGEITMGVDDAGDCLADPQAEATCLEDAGSGPTCMSACRAAGIFAGPCTEPALSTSSPDVPLAETLDENFPTILALDLHVGHHAGDGWDLLSDQALAALLPAVEAPGCEAERAEAGALEERAGIAFHQMIDQLNWVRVSVIIQDK